MQITLTSDIENALVEYARNQGVSPEILALEVLRERFIFPYLTETRSKEKESLTSRQKIMAEQAKKLVNHYKQTTSERQEWQAGDFVEY